MNKQLSINLFLARAMGYCVEHVGGFLWVPEFEHPEAENWEPHTDKAQCMEVLLFAASQGCEPELWQTMARASHVQELSKEWGSIAIDCEPNDESLMAAALEACAIAMGWRED